MLRFYPKLFLLSLFSFIFISTLLANSLSQASVTLLDKDDWKILMGGFVEVDTIYDSTRSFVETIGNNPVSKPSTVKGDNGQTQISIRNTRLAFTVLPPTQNDWKTKGYFELDFLGYDPLVPATTEAAFYSNPTMRIRHAYFSAENNGWSISAGQYWSFFGWNPSYVLSTVSVNPVAGTIYQRTTQITGIKTIQMNESDKLQLGVSLARPSQRDSQMPNIDAGARYSVGSIKSGFSSATGDINAESMTLAVTGTLRQYVTNASNDLSTGDLARFYGEAIAIDTLIPIIPSKDGKDISNTLTFAGEFTTGAGYGDSFNGFAGLPQATSATGASATPSANLDPGIGGNDVSGNFVLAKLQTWNSQLQFHFAEDWHSFATLGYGQLFFQNSGSYLGATYDKSEDLFLNVFHEFSKQMRVGLEYDRVSTHYVDNANVTNTFAVDNRVQVSGWFRF